MCAGTWHCDRSCLRICIHLLQLVHFIFGKLIVSFFRLLSALIRFQILFFVITVTLFPTIAVTCARCSIADGSCTMSTFTGNIESNTAHHTWRWWTIRWRWKILSFCLFRSKRYNRIDNGSSFGEKWWYTNRFRTITYPKWTALIKEFTKKNIEIVQKKPIRTQILTF